MDWQWYQRHFGLGLLHKNIQANEFNYERSWALKTALPWFDVFA